MLELTGITKHYGATNALEDMSFSLFQGEVCGLVGHNGAGKSTLIRIMAGAERPDSGDIWVDGAGVTLSSPADAYGLGIRVIHQDAPLVPAFDTVENCFLGRGYPKKFGRIDKSEMRRSIAEVAREIAPDLPLGRPVAFLSAAQRQFVRLLRALADEGRILVLDEPTAALPAEDAERFFEVLARMRARGTAIVLVSHRLDEIASFCDRAVVLRDGRAVAEMAGAEMNVPNLVSAMGGTHGEREHRDPVPKDAPIVLEICDLTTSNGQSMVKNGQSKANQTAIKGQITALYGLAGSGRSSLLDAIWGVEAITGGKMLLEGKPYKPRNPKDAVKAGISYVPADRHRTGLFAGLDLVFNKTIPLLVRYRRWRGVPMPNRGEESAAFVVAAKKVALAFQRPTQLAGTLSGGNQQKLLFSRWADRVSKLVLLDEPTEGVDVMAKGAIKQIIRDMAAQGSAILVSTSDREEALELGDRVVVFRDGAIVADFSRAEATPQALSIAAQAKPNSNQTQTSEQALAP